MFEDWMDLALAGVISLMVLAGVLLFVDGIQYTRAHDARVECRAAWQEPIRRPFSTDVACAPFPVRQDTTTVRVMP
jgi:hypothetical protein